MLSLKTNANTMRAFYLLLISQVSAQLRCDKTVIHATVGRELNVVCRYEANRYRFSKKYWCLGESRSSCEVLMDSDGFTKASLKGRVWITDAVFRGLYVSMTRLQLEDTGTYWVGIDKIYSDIMFMVKIKVTEEAVSRPAVWSLGSPALTCHGHSLTLCCRSKRGTGVQYSWYRVSLPDNVLLLSTSDLTLHCATLIQDAQLFCLAHNAVSTERSKPVYLHVLESGDEDCVYSLKSEGFENYDCTRNTTSTEPPTTTTVTSVEVLSSTLTFPTNRSGNHLLSVNQSWSKILFLRSWSSMPVWYEATRWFLFIILIATVGSVHLYKQVRSSHQSVSYTHRKHS